MAIDIREEFRVDAPVEAVWQFLLDPQNVAGCMPGAKLEEAVDDKNFLGSVKVKLGAVTSSYKGKVCYAEVDEAARTMRITGEGREAGGGTAKAVMNCRVGEVPEGGSEVVVEATVDLTGRVMQVGRGMIQGVSHQLFQQFVKAASKRLEVPGGPAGGGSAGDGSAGGDPGAGGGVPAVEEQEALAILPILLKTLRDAVVRFFRRLFGRPDA